MHTKRAVRPRPRRRLLAAAAVPGVLLVIAAAVAGCSGSSSSGSAAGSGPEAGPAAPAGSASATSAASAPQNGFALSGGSAPGASTTGKLARTGQQLIYTAQLTVRAADVKAAVSQAASVVSAAGGYVSGETANAAPGHPSQATATVTLKIPVAAYASTLAALSGPSLGTQLSLSQQAQDVTQQVADVSSRVASDEQAIAQLRALLRRAASVSSLLSVQDEINTQEAGLESMLAQQNALDHETSFATVTLTLVGPKAAAARAKTTPPPGLAGGATRGWHAFRTTVSWLLTVIGAVAPFAAVVLILGALGWWARRRLTRRRATPAA